jgi:uncharacterized transporter YbjL
MDLTSILMGAITPALPGLVALLSGVVTAGILQVAKKIDAIPLQEGDKAKLRMAAVVLSFGSTLTAAAANGQLASVDYSGVVGLMSGAILNYVAATGSYHLMKKPAPKAPEAQGFTTQSNAESYQPMGGSFIGRISSPFTQDK